MVRCCCSDPASCRCAVVGWRLERGVRRPDICHRERGRPHGPVHAACASTRALQALPGQHQPALQAVLENVTGRFRTRTLLNKHTSSVHARMDIVKIEISVMYTVSLCSWKLE